MTSEEEEYKINEDEKDKSAGFLESMLKSMEVSEAMKEGLATIDLCIGALHQIRGAMYIHPSFALLLKSDLDDTLNLENQMIKKIKKKEPKQ